jgi:hypothetical protein
VGGRRTAHPVGEVPHRPLGLLVSRHALWNEGADSGSGRREVPKNLFVITSLANKPIKKPEQMKGKKIGVGRNEAIWASFRR